MRRRRSSTVCKSVCGDVNRPPPRVAARRTTRHATTLTRKSGERRLERETGIEPATNSLEGCDSTTELLPPTRSPTHCLALRRAGPLSRSPTHCLSRLRRAGPLSRSPTHCLATSAGTPAVALADSPPTRSRVNRRSTRPSTRSAHSRIRLGAVGPRDERGPQGRVEWWRGKDSNLRSR